MLIPVSLPADRNAVDSVSPMVANSATGRREKPNALIFVTSSSQNGDSHFASTANSLFSINRYRNKHNGTNTDILILLFIFYAIANLFAGKFVDWMGTKKGYLIAIFVWSTGAVLHAVSGIITSGILTEHWLVGFEPAKEYIFDYAVNGTAPAWFVAFVEFMRGLPSWMQWLTNLLISSDAPATAMLAVSTISVWLFLAFRLVLAVGEAGNFPAAIKVTAEYFPKKDRAFATSIFNAGASVGALAAPATIPLLAQYFKDLGIGGGWEMAFVIIGGLGFIWMGFWVFLYEKPEKSKYVNGAELVYI